MYGKKRSSKQRVKMSESGAQIANDYKISHGPSAGRMSTYSKFLCIYTRNAKSFALNSIRDKQSSQFGKHWTEFVSQLKEANFTTTKHETRECRISCSQVEKYTNLPGIDVKITELQKIGESQIRGIITSVESENDFGNWFVNHMLHLSRLDMTETASKDPVNSIDPAAHEKLADFFAENLKNTVKHDKWLEGGRNHFVKRLQYFTSRNIKVECILPAFPCKSSNLEKVGGVSPDMGEFMALHRLVQAAKDVAQFYPPGIKFWIVSDGHVFSDCIGVDDDVVDEYTEHLHKQYQTIKETSDKEEHVGFFGLKDIFYSGKFGKQYDPKWNESLILPHFTGTKIQKDSETCRKIMMRGCDTDDGRLEEQVKIPNHPRLLLYRGFAKFMEEDLKRLPYFANHSRKQFKKTASRVAFEMIKRNDAYSNLVDLIFPHHMRLSIHAHPNSGPKFGIKVISDEKCRMVKSLENNEKPIFEDFLHIPTPWHNTVVYISDDDQYYLTRSNVVHSAIKKGYYAGEWVPNNGAGYFHISKVSYAIPTVDGSASSIEQESSMDLSSDSLRSDVFSQASRNDSSFTPITSNLSTGGKPSFASINRMDKTQKDRNVEELVQDLKKKFIGSGNKSK